MKPSHSTEETRAVRAHGRNFLRNLFERQTKAPLRREPVWCFASRPLAASTYYYCSRGKIYGDAGRIILALSEEGPDNRRRFSFLLE
jgi:hypothetical protein